jgi:hypothetical protein
MNRPLRISLLIAIAIALAACIAPSSADVPTASPAAAPSATPTQGPSIAPTMTPPVSASPVATPVPVEPTPDPATVLAANGIGPYVVGAALADLESSGLVTNVADSINCDASWQGADATGRYAEQLGLTFHQGRLTDVGTQSTELETPSGARVRMPLTELQRIYGSRGTLIEGMSGNQAFSVRVSQTALGIVFYLEDTNTKVLAMSAGEVERLEQAAVIGEGC